MQFKGAGEKEFEEEKAKNISNDISTPRSVELVILKTRNRKTGEKIGYEMYSVFNFFRKVSDDWKPSLTSEKTKETEISKVKDDNEYDISGVE